jgi:ribosomal protein S18 acetylase RimI-like enzyme
MVLEQEHQKEGFVIRSGDVVGLSNDEQREFLCQILASGAAARLPVRGASMHPFIRDKDVLVIARGDPALSQPGDVAAFIHPDDGRLVIHRLISRSESGWLMRGDNLPQPDGFIQDDAILGFVTRIERSGRSLDRSLGIHSRLIAWLSGHGLLGYPGSLLHHLLRLPQMVNAGILRTIQSIPLYRRLNRRFSAPVQIHPASTAELGEVYRHFLPGTLDRPVFSEPSVSNFVATQKGRIAGFVQVIRFPAEAEIYCGYWLFSLEVWRHARGRGIGEALTRHVLDLSQAEGAERVFLAVDSGNGRAIAMYRKLGFELFTHSSLDARFQEERKLSGRLLVVMCKVL